MGLSQLQTVFTEWCHSWSRTSVEHVSLSSPGTHSVLQPSRDPPPRSSVTLSGNHWNRHTKPDTELHTAIAAEGITPRLVLSPAAITAGAHAWQRRAAALPSGRSARLDSVQRVRRRPPGPAITHPSLTAVHHTDARSPTNRAPQPTAHAHHRPQVGL